MPEALRLGLNENLGPRPAQKGLSEPAQARQNADGHMSSAQQWSDGAHAPQIGRAEPLARREFVRDAVRYAVLGALAVGSAWAIRPKAAARPCVGCASAWPCDLCQIGRVQEQCTDYADYVIWRRTAFAAHRAHTKVNP